ncbi:MAG: rRNA maturation RNase YbeY [Patescibacteria group bacterium]
MPVAINNTIKQEIDKRFFQKTARSVFRVCKKSLSKYQLSIALVDNRTIRRLNKQYRNKNKITTVLSFSFSEESGEIVLAVPEIRKKSQEEGISFKNNLQRILVHGLLHLCGYHHGNQKEARRAEALEYKILAR